MSNIQLKLVEKKKKKKSCMSTSGGPLAAGLRTRGVQIRGVQTLVGLGQEVQRALPSGFFLCLLGKGRQELDTIE